MPTRFAPAERAAPAEVRASHDALAAVPLLCRVLDGMPIPVVVLNRQRQIVLANQALLRAVGADREADVLGQRPGEVLGCVHAKELAGGCGTSEACRTCGLVRASLERRVGRHDTRDARLLVRDDCALDLRAVATPFPLGGERLVLIALLDIQAEKRKEALENVFFHDLLNTAMAVRGLVELLPGSGERERGRFTKMLEEQSRQLVESICQQKDLRSAELGELRLKPAPLRSLEVLHVLADLYRRQPAGSGRRLAISAASRDAALFADKTVLLRVLGNLVKNALEASPSGATVTLWTRPEEDGVEFRVSNPGVMPREVQLQVFERSFSTKGPGRGLGTYGARLLTERYLGGDIGFESDEEEGTRFWVRLPAAPSAGSGVPRR